MKKTIALILCIVMLVAVFTGCQSASATTASTAASTTAAKTTAAPTTTQKVVKNFNPTGFPIVSTPIKLSYLSVNWWNYTAQNYAEDEWLNEIEQKTGIRLDPVVIPSTDATSKRNVMLASGNYPEVICASFSRAEIIQFGVQDHILVDLKSAIDSYGNELKKIFAYKDIYYKGLIAPDGAIYGLPSIDEGYHTQAYPKMYIRQDWLNKLNLKMPTDTESFRAMLKAFVSTDLNGDGKKNEIGITGGTQSCTPVQWCLIGQAFTTCRPGLWLNQDKTSNAITFAPATEAYRDGLKYVKSLYDEGLIDKAAFTNTNAQLQVTIRTKPYSVGAYVCDHPAMGVDSNNYEEYKNYQVLSAPLKGPAGFQEQPSNNSFGEVGSFAVAVTDKCANVEAAVRFIDYMMSEEQTMLSWLGKEGRNWKKVDAGSNLKNILGGPVKYEKLTGYESSGTEKPKPYHTLSTFYFKSLELNNSAMAAVTDIYEAKNYEQRIMLDTVSLKDYRRKSYLPLGIFIPIKDNSAFNTIQTNLNDFIDKTAVQFILGERKLDADWDAYLKELKNYGVDKYVSIYTNAYNSMNK